MTACMGQAGQSDRHYSAVILPMGNQTHLQRSSRVQVVRVLAAPQVFFDTQRLLCQQHVQPSADVKVDCSYVVLACSPLHEHG